MCCRVSELRIHFLAIDLEARIPDALIGGDGGNRHGWTQEEIPSVHGGGKASGHVVDEFKDMGNTLARTGRLQGEAPEIGRD